MIADEPISRRYTANEYPRRLRAASIPSSTRAWSRSSKVIFRRTSSALAYVYFEEEPGRQSAAHLLTQDDGSAHRRQHPKLLTRPRLNTGFR
jgi:hypothetical protein